MAQLPACLVGLEACGRSHHWARVLQGYGHEVKLMAPQQDQQSLHRVRSLAVAQRTALVNQVARVVGGAGD